MEERQPVAQRPAELTPLASARHFFGAELRHWRNQRGLSLAQLGRAVYVSADLIGKVEKAQRWPRAALVDQFEAVLDAAGILRRLYALADDERRTSNAWTRRPTHVSDGDSETPPATLVVIMAGPDDVELPRILERAGVAVSAASLVRARPAGDPAAAVVDLDAARARRTARTSGPEW
jgi:transcriptional regulator with XRE-family HTH domain